MAGILFASPPQTRISAFLLLVEKLLDFGLKGREDSKVIETYNRGIKYWKGNHPRRYLDKYKGNKVYNKFAEIVETRLSQLTDARPKWIFRPQEEEDIQIAHALNQILGDVIWDYIDWDKGDDGGGKSEDSVLQASFCGSSHIKTVLDVHNGYPNFVVMPAGTFVPDPKAKKKKHLRFWIHLAPTSVKRIKRQYGKDVKAQADLERIYEQDKADFHRPQLTAQMDTTNETMDSTPFLIDTKDETKDFGSDFLGKAVVVECWLEDFTMQAIPYDEAETEAEHDMFSTGEFPQVSLGENHPKHIKAHEVFLNTLDPNVEVEIIANVNSHIENHGIYPQETSGRKYPYGRVITICQGQLLADKPNPFSDLGLDFRDVLIKWDYSKNPEGYWGKPLTTDLFDPQDDLNHRKNSITRNINLLNQGIRKIKWNLWTKLGIKDNPSKINNMIGNVIPFINDPNEYTTDFGTAFPSQIWADIGWTERHMDSQSVHSSVGRGELPAAGTANVTLETLLGEFKTILRKPLRHYAGALSEMGRNAILIMVKYMDETERFTILGEDQQTYEQMSWGEIRDRAALMRNVRIDTASLLPTSRMETFRKVIEMMQAGVPPEVAMQLLDDPKAIQAMQTMSQINQLSAALEQMGEENEQLKQQLNTMVNRLQGETGMGNAGIFNTG
jgi:hypothetical protein